MSKELGYVPAKGPDGKERFKPSGSENKGGQAPRQDGGNTDKKVNARSHNWNEDGAVNGDPEKGTSKGKSL
jgi:hypothetical protein